MFGLFTVGLKIWQRRSAFSLVRLNSWAAYAVLLALALGNWEIWIARYNLQPRFTEVFDPKFLLEMPPRVLPELRTHAARFTESAHVGVLHRRVAQFVEAYPQRGWPSWNYADAYAYMALTRADKPIRQSR